MMGKDSSIDEFTGAIDKAIDELFNPLQESVLSPEAETSSPNNGKIVDSQANVASAGLQGKGEMSLFTQAEEALMSLEWEITPHIITQFQKRLDALREEINLEVDLSQLFALMDKVLSRIAAAPEDAPISGPNSLKNALGLVRQIYEQSDQSAAISKSKMPKVIAALEASVTQAVFQGTVSESHEVDSGEDKQQAQSVSAVESAHVASGISLISDGLYSDLKYHRSIMQQCVKMILPVEGLFKKTKGYEKFHLLIKSIRQQLEKQSVYYRNSLSSDYASAGGNAVPIPDPLYYAIQSHISMLHQCIQRILQAENIFAKANGMEKLYSFHRRLREQLERQRDCLRASSNQADLAVPPVVKEVEPQQVMPTEPEPVSAAPQVCPWAALLVAQWGGQEVAFIPEQIAYVGPLGWRIKRKAKSRALFPLKCIRPWPWSRLASRLQGTLAQQKESELKKMALQVLSWPAQFQQRSTSKELCTTLIIEQKSEGVVVFLNSTPENITVPEKHQWEQEQEKNSIVAGYVTVNDHSYPVVSLE